MLSSGTLQVRPCKLDGGVLPPTPTEKHMGSLFR